VTQTDLDPAVDVGTLFVTRDIFSSLMENRSLMGFSLGCERGLARLDLVLKPGLAAATGRYTVCFGPDRLLLADHQSTLDLGGKRRKAAPELLVHLLANPQVLERELKRSKLDATNGAPPPCGPRIEDAAIAMLLRHVAISDLAFGSDGTECSLQFRLTGGFPQVCQRPPFDWVGLDFGAGHLDLSWFRPEGDLLLKAHRWPSQRVEIERITRDPLGAVLSHGEAAFQDTGARSLLKTLQSRLEPGV
jgi:hypothetical protein